MRIRICCSRVRRGYIVELLRSLKVQSLVWPSYATILEYICMEISTNSFK